MRPRLSILLSLLVSSALAASAGAAGEGAAVKATFVDDNTPEVAEIRQLGEAAINRLATTFMREAISAVAKDGPEAAVDVCHLKSLPNTNGTVAGLPRITAMKCTSLQLRSLANAPDAAEKLVLNQIQQQLENGDPPSPLLVQRVELPGAAPEWRVYKPLGVQPKCLACHGESAAQSDALQAKLRRLYPQDEATSFKAGAWRGVMRVTVAAAPAKKP